MNFNTLEYVLLRFYALRKIIGRRSEKIIGAFRVPVDTTLERSRPSCFAQGGNVENKIGGAYWAPVRTVLCKTT